MWDTCQLIVFKADSNFVIGFLKVPSTSCIFIRLSQIYMYMWDIFHMFNFLRLIPVWVSMCGTSRAKNGGTTSPGPSLPGPPATAHPRTPAGSVSQRSTCWCSIRSSAPSMLRTRHKDPLLLSKIKWFSLTHNIAEKLSNLNFSSLVCLSEVWKHETLM